MLIILALIVGSAIAISIWQENFIIMFFGILAAAMLMIAMRANPGGVGGDSDGQTPKLLKSHDTEKRPPFIDATGAQSGALLGDVKHDPFQSGGLETPPHQRVEVGAIHEAHNGVLFIDEIHRINVSVEEYLYTAMEDFSISITIDPGPHSRTVEISLEPFTLVGATTRQGLLTAPLRSRFQIFERLDFYRVDELTRIARNSASVLGIEIKKSAAELIASRSRGTPRVTNRLLRRVRDVAHARDSEKITKSIAEEGLARLGVDENGLDEMDRRILRAIARNGGKPVGLKTIAVVVGEQEDTIEDVYEPFLIREGFLKKTPRGRQLTQEGLTLVEDEMGERRDSDGRGGLF